MLKDNRYYTFLLSHKTKEKIYIRRLEVSKNIMHTSAASLILCVGLASFGIFGFVSNNIGSVASADSGNLSDSALMAKQVKQPEEAPINEVRRFNYDRPNSSDEFANDSAGGPTSGSFQLTAVDSEREETDIERKLQKIEKTSNPKFLPTIWAHLGKINNEFGFRRNPFGGRSYEFHAGMDIDGDKGDMIVAPANGLIKKAGWQGGYGYLIEIDHGNGLTTRFGHLSKVEVKEGDMIERGQLIGLVGSTGRSTGPHLHYELRLETKPINPRRFLPPQPSEIK